MPESLSDNLGVDAGDEEEARLGVAQVVEAYPRQAEPGDERAEPAAKQLALEEEPAPRACEHQRQGPIADVVGPQSPWCPPLQ